MDENFIKEQLDHNLLIQKTAYGEGWKAGYKAKEKELEDQKDKEIEAMYQDSLVDEEFARKSDWDALLEKEK